MIREEAINQLKDFIILHREQHGWDVSTLNALDMAIKVLEQTNELDKIRAEIKEWYWQADKQALAKDPCVVDAMIDLFIRTIDKYKAESEEI